MNKKLSSVLVYGYGNPGRQDDGLGILLAQRVEAAALPGIEVDMNYQLNVEDAYDLSQKDAVIFLDASMNDLEDFRFYKLSPSMQIQITTHSMPPASVLSLCKELYNKDIPAYMLEMKGSSWEMGVEELTENAAAVLEKAEAFLKPLLAEPTLERFAQAAAEYSTFEKKDA